LGFGFCGHLLFLFENFNKNYFDIILEMAIPLFCINPPFSTTEQNPQNQQKPTEQIDTRSKPYLNRKKRYGNFSNNEIRDN
jgi:hypothetical protein